ncbi:MAG: NADPH-dependent oxidoreductase [Tissierellia bacterium]|jgi:nitroreductase|nr:NADPH-dependent oxidoreductase [Tissierellia bacterium]
MNSTISHQLAHRAIREFTDQPIDQATIETLKAVVNRTATSVGMQSYSLIRVQDHDIRAQIAAVGRQDYINRIPEFWVFLVDCYRNAMVSRQQGFQLETEGDMDRFFQGWTDASLAAQNLLNAVESLGLGGNFYGCILNDADRIIDILGLPALTMPVVGVGFGYPNQDPMLKPRMSMDHKMFQDRYVLFDDYVGMLQEYDEQMKQYYDLRQANKPMDSFTKQVVDKLHNPIGKRADLINTLKRQGFTLGLEEA